MPIPAVAYVRVSTEGQDPRNQVEYLSRWASARGFEILRFYIDEAVSGATPVLERAAFRELIRDVEGGLLNPRPMVLLVYEMSRLVRNFQELFRLLDVIENRLGLLIVSASEREGVMQSLDGVYRQFLRTILAFVASMEREFTRQRTRAAMERLRAEGKVRSSVDDLPEDVVREIIEARARGEGLRSIARRLGLSLYAGRRVVYSRSSRPDPKTCPRCHRHMKVIDRSLVQVNGTYAVKEILHCVNCGNEEVRVG